jgi:N-acetylneuraminic acid mutarotase
MGILRVKQRLNKMRIRQIFRRARHRLTIIVKGVLLFVDRTIHKVLSYILRKLHRIKFFRPLAEKIYRFTRMHHRFTSLAVAGVLILTIAAPVLQIIAYNKQYALSSQARTLLGEPNDSLSKKITYDEQARLYQFNKDAKKDPTTEGNPLAKMQSQVGGAGEKDTQQHSIDIPKDLSKGITYYDNQMELSFKLIPEFTTKQGGLKEGHLIYPLTEAKGQVAYTVLNSGLKENIILYKSPGDTFKTSYFLDLPKSLEAKLIPETGEVGIYSADPTLFGNISYGSSDDQARVEGARNSSKKDYLTFKIPAPVVMGLNGNDQSTVAPVKSKFSLQNNTLTVTTTGLEKADYPLAIDPSVSIDSTSDFQTGNQEDDNSTIDSGSIKRSALSGGAVGSWTNNPTNMPASIYYHSSVAYNGYLYTISGQTVRYAPISGDGSIGSWTGAPDLIGGQSYAAASVYNGYLYVSGGGITSLSANVRYSKINSSNGSLGQWDIATSLPSGRGSHQMVAYNGYMYTIGGTEASTPVTQTFNHTGGQQTYTVPAGVTSVTVDALGASGDPTGFPNGDPGRGGRVQSTLAVTPGQTLYVLVGGQGGSSGGYNGGNGVNRKGGGASDVRQGGTALTDRKIVAGGGGSGALQGLGSAWAGGHGGYPAGTNYSSPSGAAGTQSAGGAAGPCSSPCVVPAAAGSLGQGGQAGRDSSGDAGGGGGGYYGGGGGGIISVSRGGGGGGSSYAGSGTSATTYTTGHQTGAGQIVITSQVISQVNSVQYAPIKADGTLGSWAATTSFTNGRAFHQAAAYNGYMYILGGGITSGASYDDVQYAPIKADGTLGSWAATTSFTGARRAHSTVISRGHIYVIGSSSYTNDVQYARINTDGTIGAWNTTTTFNTGRGYHTSVAYNGRLYIIGGYSSGGAADDIQYTTINAPGAASNFKTNASSFATARQEHSAAVVGNYLYVIGGQNQAGAYYNDVQYAPINADGSIGSWASSTLPAANAHHELVVYNGRIYVVGGYNGTSLGLNTIWYAQPATNGSIVSWSTANLPVKRYWHAAVAYNGYMYVLGGTDGTTTFATVYTTPINANGSLGTWFSNGTYVTSRSNHTAVAYNGYLYVAGGGSNTVQYALLCNGYNSGVGGCSSFAGGIGTWNTTAPLASSAGGMSMAVSSGYMYAFSFGNTNTYRALINNDGTLNTWQLDSSLPAIRGGAGVAAANGNIYVTGGNNNSTTLYNTVLYAQINNGGGGGATGWASSGTNFTNARYNHATVAHNGYLYIIGGFNSGTHYADVQKVPILENGGLGTWVSGGPDLPSGRSGIAAVANNGYMYVLGGKNTGGFLNEVQRAPIDPSTGMLGSWTPDTSFAGARHATAAVVSGGYVYILGGNDAGPQTTTLDYTGAQQTYTVPAGVTSVKVTAQGADGGGVGYYGSDVGGSGSYVESSLSVTPGETLYVQVGGDGSTSNGYNGGGTSGDGGTGSGYDYKGGGASDVRQGGTALANRKVVAAGGGGAGGSTGGYSTYGGGGGTFTNASNGGNNGTGVCGPGLGATSGAGGAGGSVAAVGNTEEAGAAGVLGVGGKGGNSIGGGGGGGYYGGGGGGGWLAFAGCGGGGGTSYAGSGTSNMIAYPGYDGSAGASNGQVSITYGKAAYNDVQYAQINSNGTLGTWTSTTNMLQDRTLHAATIANGYIYAAGGTNGAGSIYRSIEYAPINPGGTIGTWSQAPAMSSPRQNISLAVANGYMYAVGGHSGTSFLNSVEYAPISSNGKVGNWQTTQSMGNIRSSEGKSATSYNGRLYVTGGYNGVNAAQNTTEYTALQSTPRKFSYSKVIDLGTTSNVTGLSFTGNAQVSRDNLGLKYKVGNSSGVFGAYKSNGSFSCTEGDSGRYVQIFLTLDDEKIAAFKDEDGLRSVLDSVTVDSVPFIAPTEKRLRHGAFFQGQALQPFNTNSVQCS